ncbi:MAG: hypothetical protein Q4G67_08310 [Actinomycetia bacterium]|nr:hypothetical protein [Actinomycetes bacterium]
MMATLQHPLVEAYLARLDALLVSAPTDRRAEVRADLMEHLEEALAQTDGSDAEVREVLSRLGEPEDVIAAMDLPDPTAPAPEQGRPQLEMWSLGLIFGSIALVATVFLSPFSLLLLIPGLILLALSQRWSGLDKAIGFIAYGPLGPLPAMAVAMGFTFVRACHTEGLPDGTVIENCTGGAPAWMPFLVIPAAIALIVLWVYAGWRLHKNAHAGTAAQRA